MPSLPLVAAFLLQALDISSSPLNGSRHSPSQSEKLSLSFPNQTVELAGSVYPIPFTDTTLLINFGRTLRPEFLSHFLDEVEMQVIKDIERYGGKSRIPSGGFDQNRDGFIFSVYSPQELPSRRHVTREILKDVVDGVGGIVIGDRRFKEVYFAIQTGSEKIFRGYGHFVAQRKGTSS